MSEIGIRDYRPEDRAAVRRVCFETGLMGDSIASQYSDLESFADMFTSYYTDAEPEQAFVAERDGKVLGYMFGCLDSRRAWRPQLIAMSHVLRRGVCFRPGVARFYWRALADELVDLFRPGRKPVDLSRYPAHLHTNLLPEGRAAGVGKELFFHVFDRLVEKGANGIHGDVVIENANILRFVQKKVGFILHAGPYPIPGMRDPNGGRLSGQTVVRDLSDWVPGAWRGAQPSASPSSTPARP